MSSSYRYQVIYLQFFCTCFAVLSRVVLPPHVSSVLCIEYGGGTNCFLQYVHCR